MSGRIDRASAFVAAPRGMVWRCLAEPDLLVRWLPPAGMDGTVEVYDLRPDGAYRIVLRYRRGGEGKTTADTDLAEGRFVQVAPPHRLVQTVRFASPDPAFAGEMRMTWALTAASGGTDVSVTAEDVPPGISAEDHDAGLRSSLANLARLAEGVRRLR